MPLWIKEDERIILVIKKNNPKARWKNIPEVLIGKHTAAACRQRYYLFNARNEAKEDHVVNIVILL